nr:GGDEF domain-containing protein [Lachnospiraceae bacterium]
EHMIREHGAVTFNYIGGPKDNDENNLRYNGFCDCLKDNGLTLDPDRVINLAYLYGDGITAYEYFRSKGLHCADAIISVNDSMALGYCEAAAKDGLFAPNDFKICGMDDFKPASEVVPSISTINLNWENMGYKGAELIDMYCNGEKLPDRVFSEEKLQFRQSCGCIRLEQDYRAKSLTEYKKDRHVEDIMIAHRFILTHLCNSRNIEQMQARIPKVVELLKLSHMAICVNSSILESECIEEKSGYDELLLACTETGIEKIRRKEQLVPDSWESPESLNVLFFSPLYFLKNTFGYTVIPYDENLVDYTKQRILFENISISIETIRQRSELNAINNRLQDMYIHDSLTGLYNRFGYGEYANDFYEKYGGRVYIIFVDLNKLKEINDIHGHAMGDRAIKCVADAISNTFPKENICVRMGGDEYLIMGAFESESDIVLKEEQVKEYLEYINKNNMFSFKVSASMGHSFNNGREKSLSELVKEADSQMYKVKRSRR